MDADQIQSIVDWLQNAGAVPFTIAACIIISYAFRYWPQFPNKWIPVVCILIGPVVFCILNPRAAGITGPVFYTHSIVGGLAIGLLAWLIHDKWISQIEDKIVINHPQAAKILTSTADDGTKTFPKPPPANP